MMTFLFLNIEASLVTNFRHDDIFALTQTLPVMYLNLPKLDHIFHSQSQVASPPVKSGVASIKSLMKLNRSPSLYLTKSCCKCCSVIRRRHCSLRNLVAVQSICIGHECSTSMLRSRRTCQQ